MVHVTMLTLPHGLRELAARFRVAPERTSTTGGSGSSSELKPFEGCPKSLSNPVMDFFGLLKAVPRGILLSLLPAFDHGFTLEAPMVLRRASLDSSKALRRQLR